MAESDLADRAREVIRQMDGRTPPLDLEADLATIDSVLTAPGAERLSALQVVILLGHRGDTLSGAGRERDAADVYAEAITRFADDADPAVAHQLDLVRMHLADCLMTSLHLIDEGEALAIELLDRFERSADDRYRSYKGLMLMELTHLLFALGRDDVARRIAESVARRLSSTDEMSRSVVAECSFYLTNLIARDGRPADAAGKARASLGSGQPVLQGLERIAQRFAQSESGNPVWLLQVDMQRAMIMIQDEQPTQARQRILELQRRARRSGLPDELRDQIDRLAHDLAEHDDGDAFSEL